MPKVYVRDSGILHALLGTPSEHDILAHPRVGLSWEGFAIEETVRTTRPDWVYFRATHTGPNSICFSSRAASDTASR